METNINGSDLKKDEPQVSKEIVIKAIANKLGHDNFTISNYHLKPFSNERIGLLGDHLKLFVSVQNIQLICEENYQFFVKLFPRLTQVADFAEKTGSFKKECFIYEVFDLFIKEGVFINDCVPRCYFKEPRTCLIFDDLISKGYQQLNKHETLDYNSVLVVLQYLAKFHACTIIYEERKSKELQCQYRLIYEFPHDFEECFYRNEEEFVNYSGVQATIKGVVNEIDIFNIPQLLPSGNDLRVVTEKICKKIYNLVRPSEKYRNVICHGDLWATNYLLKLKKGPLKSTPLECKFVDLQQARYIPPAHDVMSFLYLNTDMEFRRKYMYQVIGMYYSYLEKFLKSAGVDSNILPFDQFLESCEEQKLFAILQTAFCFPLILIRNEDIEKYFSNEEIGKKALFEDRSILVQENIHDEDYVKRVKESILDLRNYCVYL